MPCLVADEEVEARVLEELVAGTKDVAATEEVEGVADGLAESLSGSDADGHAVVRLH